MDSSAEGSGNGGSKTAERTVKSMNVYKKDTMKDLVKDNSYVGRGIVIGKTEDGTKAAVAYFIMGRSDNSRNRIFKEEGEDVMIYPFDAPNWTPRISGMLTFAENDFTYKMSILKSADEAGTACNRFTYSYKAIAGVGHFLHTYMGDGSPLPTFTGEPERASIPNDIDAWTKEIWENLNEQNKISIYVRFTDLKTGAVENRMINKNV